MLQIETIQVTPFMQNARILHCTASNEAVLIDPGGEAPKIAEAIRARKCQLKAIWLTHSHLDHVGAVKELLALTPVQLAAHPDEKLMRATVANVAAMYGIPDGEFENCPEPDVYIKGGES